MYRDRIRVRPAGGRPSLNFTNNAIGGDESYMYASKAATGPAYTATVNDAQRGATATSSFPPDEEENRDGLQYARRIAQLAYDTVSSVFGAFRGRPSDAEALDSISGFSAPQSTAAALASPAVPPNTPYTTVSADSAEEANHWAPETTTAARPSDTLERRQPHPYDYHRPSTYAPPQQPRYDDLPRPAVTTSVPRALPVRDAPQYQITVNQYFAAPERGAYPVVATPPAPAYAFPPHGSAAVGYTPRVSLLTVPSAIRPQAKRERVGAAPVAAKTEKAAPEQPLAKAAKTADPFAAASEISLSNAPSAIPRGSAENSLTVPISVVGSGGAALFDKGKDTAAPLFGPKPATAPAAAGFTFGAKPTTTSTTANPAAAPPVSTPPSAGGAGFTFGAKPTTAAPTPPPAPAAAGGFFKAGPPAVIAEDDGFATDADSDDDDKRGAPTAAAPAKAAFSFSTTAPKPTFGAAPAPAAAAAAPPANPFSFSPKPAEKPSTAAPASTSTAPKTNSFFKAGPPAVMADDDGFAPNADKDDDGTAAPATKPLTFSFSSSGQKPAFGVNTATTAAPPATAVATASPASPPKMFSFAPKPADTAPASNAASFPSSFVKAGLPAVKADDNGFAPNADSDGDGDAKRTRTEKAAPTPSPFSFSASPTGAAPKPAFGSGGGASFGAPASSSAAPTSNPFTFGTAATSEAPANPFKFGGAPPAAAPFGSAATGGASTPFGTGASSPFGSGGAAPAFTFSKSK